MDIRLWIYPNRRVDIDYCGISHRAISSEGKISADFASKSTKNLLDSTVGVSAMRGKTHVRAVKLNGTGGISLFHPMLAGC